MPHPSITAQTHPHRPAYIMASSGETVTYRELDERSNQIAHLFRSIGLQSGDHIALMLKNSREFMEICWGAQRSGLIYTPVSTHLKKDEVDYILNNSKAKALIIGHSLLSIAGDAGAADETEVAHRFVVGGPADGYAAWEESVDVHPATPIADERFGTPMLYSSGTTGRPKGIPEAAPGEDIHLPDALSVTVGDAFGFGEGCVYLTPAPLYHAAPLRYNIMNVYKGGTSVIMEKFDPEAALQAIERYQVTHSQWVPIMFIRMLKLPKPVRTRYDLSSMRMAIHSAAPCPVEIKEKMIDWWGEIIMEYYAASEGIGFTIIDSAQWLKHRGSVGKPTDGTLHIVDDDGNELPPHEVGTVYIGDYATDFEYHDEPDKTADVFNSRGWATMGDVGYVDEDGYLYLTDRKNFMIISGGVNIYPQEIENLLITHEKVADVAVFGVPDDEFGESVQAVVQPLSWADAGAALGEQLELWARERLSNVKVPRFIDFQRELPRMDNGKLYKKRLVSEYPQGRNAV